VLSSFAVNILLRIGGVVVLVAILVPQTSAQELRLGAAVYEANCAPCHGQLYDPGGPLGPEAGAIPAFYVGGRYLMSISPPNIRAAVLLGVPGTGMNGLGGELSDEQLDALIAYIEALRYRAALRGW
jgi:mono/diheme cytochrome c family protein